LDYAEGWDITETETEIHGDTIMDNFDMQGFMKQIGIPMDLVKFKSGNCGRWSVTATKNSKKIYKII